MSSNTDELRSSTSAVGTKLLLVDDYFDSAEALSLLLQGAAASGFEQHIQKPIAFESLLAALAA